MQTMENHTCEFCKKEIHDAHIIFTQKTPEGKKYYHIRHAPGFNIKSWKESHSIYCPECLTFYIIIFSKKGEPGEFYHCPNCSHQWDNMDYINKTLIKSHQSPVYQKFPSFLFEYDLSTDLAFDLATHFAHYTATAVFDKLCDDKDTCKRCEWIDQLLEHIQEFRIPYKE